MELENSEQLWLRRVGGVLTTNRARPVYRRWQWQNSKNIACVYSAYLSAAHKNNARKPVGRFYKKIH